MTGTDLSTTDYVAAVVGNPKAGSRTLTAAAALAEALSTWVSSDTTPARAIDLAEIADGLLAPWKLSAAAQDAAALARSARLLVIATPTYKASYTGLLKLFLDTFPAGSLAHTVVVPLTTSGGPAHRHLADIQLRPVLAELGAVVPAPSLLLEESELPQLESVVAAYAAQYGRLIGAAVTALAPVAGTGQAAVRPAHAASTDPTPRPST